MRLRGKFPGNPPQHRWRVGRRLLPLRTGRTAVGVAITGFVSLASVALAQDPSERPLSIHVGAGLGYTAAPGYAGESSGGGWNGEAFVLVAPRGIPVELRPTVFTYGRGTSGILLTDAPCPSTGCRVGVTPYFSGTERATGGSLDATVRLAHGLLVPYIVAGLGAVGVSRQNAEGLTVHSTGLAYDYGAGVRVTVGGMTLFGEAKFFATRASAEQFDGHSVHMIPLTVGLTF
jgi:hypothetical protein